MSEANKNIFYLLLTCHMICDFSVLNGAMLIHRFYDLYDFNLLYLSA